MQIRDGQFRLAAQSGGIKPKVKKVTKVKKVPKPKAKWRWDSHVVDAHTKSEARSLLKKKLKLNRLPVGANIVKID
jgi:hypothetical protein